MLKILDKSAPYQSKLYKVNQFLSQSPKTGFMHRSSAGHTWPYGRPVTHQT